MEITEVRIRKSENTGTLQATASITFDEVLVVRDMRIVNGSTGLFVAFPSKVVKKEGEEDKYFDIVFPLDKKFRASVQERVLEEYRSEEPA
jgi:stage V sporulation protein G